MLIIHYDYYVRDDFYPIDGAFTSYYDKNWMLDPDIPAIAKSIDGCTQIAPNVFDHPEFGTYSGRDLAGGTKAIIMAMAMPKEVFSLGCLGPNCAEALYIASQHHNIQFAYKNYFFPMHPDIKIMLTYDNCRVIRGCDMPDYLK